MIGSFAFGSIMVNDRCYSHDIKIIDGRLWPHWLRSSGHRAELSDVQDIPACSPDVVVFGCGEPGYMQVSEAPHRYFEETGIEVIEAKTADNPSQGIHSRAT